MSRSSPEMQQALLSKLSGRELGRVNYSQANGDDTPIITATGIADFRADKPMTPDTINGIGSISKQFTAATLLKLWDDGITDGSAAANFPRGIDTTIDNFMPRLCAKFPKCAETFARIQSDESYSEITLRDLLNHTHGLGGRDNAKAMELVRRDDLPISLTDIINTTQKLPSDRHGEHSYSNFGFDFAAMIIEVIADKDFDLVVKEKVLDPLKLTSTHAQSDHLALYEDPATKLSRGYILDSDKFGNKAEVKDYSELNFNSKSNTRAAGGFKSSVTDMARFAPAFMGAEMFANPEVKEAVTAYDCGINIHVGRNKDGSLQPGKLSYHLGMKVGSDGTVGHDGADCDFYADLRFNPTTGEVNAWVQVVEGLSSHVCDRVFEAINPEDAKTLQDFLFGKGDSLIPRLISADSPKEGEEEFNKVVDGFFGDKAQTEGFAAMARYTELHREILAIPLADLVARREEIVSELITEKSIASFKELPNSLEQKTDGRFAKRFSGDKKAQEFEDIGNDSKKSWVGRILNANQSMDDSVIKR